eukprot:10476732-Heterocapsa_arctica.AAC.1
MLGSLHSDGGMDSIPLEVFVVSTRAAYSAQRAFASTAIGGERIAALGSYYDRPAPTWAPTG